MGIVEAQTRPSFQPIATESVKAEMTVVMRLRIAPKVAPLKPAIFVAPVESMPMSAPLELELESSSLLQVSMVAPEELVSKNAISCLRIACKVADRTRRINLSAQMAKTKP